MYTLSLLATAQIYENESAGWMALDSVQPGNHTSFPIDGTTPSVVVSITPSYVFVGIQGTQTFGQWVLNVLGSAQVDVAPGYGAIAFVFGQQAGAVFAKVDPVIRSAIRSRRLVFTGHSLGGAIAQVLAVTYVKLGFTNTAAFVFGSPRVGDEIFASIIDPFTYRAENQGDPIIGLPPTTWCKVGASWPGDPPPPFCTYAAGGVCYTADISGNLTFGSSPPPTETIVEDFFTGNMIYHYAQEYTRRLRIGLTQADFLSAGYANASGPDLTNQELTGFGLPRSLPQTAEGSDMRRIQMFFNYGTRAGVSEEFYYTGSDSFPIVRGVIDQYLSFRLALATKDFVFQYARESDYPATRIVRWFDQSDMNNTVGQYSAGNESAPAQALLLRMVNSAGAPNRIFLHGFPGSQFNGERYTPNGAFPGQVNAFVALLAGGTYLYKTNQVPHDVGNRQGITAISPIAPRGCVITQATPPVVLTAGDSIYIGGQGSRILGLNGTKIVTVGTVGGGTSFTIGGAQPVGNVADLAAGCYFYQNGYVFNPPTFASIRGLTSHKVGRPFDAFHGRRSNTVALRQ